MYRSGWDRLDLLRADFERALDELTAARRRRAAAHVDDHEPQSVPVNVFETESELMVVAAMPGLEGANVDITIEDDRITLRGGKRGPGQENRRYHRREWTYGSYERTIRLPVGVDIDRANATYGNGVVTIALPKAQTRRSRRIEIKPETAEEPREVA